MKRILRRDAREYYLTVQQPRLEVSPGEPFVIETEDAVNGLLRSEDDLPVPERYGSAYHPNPLGGPVYVRGARPGDTLVIEVRDIVVDNQGVAIIEPGAGPLSESARYPECRGPYTRIIRHIPGLSGTTSDGKGVFDEQTIWDLHPHIGTIGTAPQNAISAGADSAVGQGSYGGNMDVRDVCRGNKIMLPVFHEGAYLYAGDVHASQADSEFTGSADESRSEVTLSCEIDPGKHIPAPRIETPTSIIQLHSFRPLEDAVQQAFFWLIDWLVTDYGWSPRDAYMQMSVNPDVRIHVYQMVKIGRIHYTAGVEIPKKYLS